MRDIIISSVLSCILGALLATNYWLKTIPADFMQLYDKQAVVLDKCIDKIGD